MAPAKKAPAKKAAATKKAPAKKAPAKKVAAKKKAPAKKAPAKKVAAKKAPAKRTAAKKAPARKRSAASSAAAPAGSSPVQQQILGEITSWNPSSGQGVVKLPTGEVPFDVMKTPIVNKGYVDLHVGRQVGVTPTASEADGEFEALEAF